MNNLQACSSCQKYIEDYGSPCVEVMEKIRLLAGEGHFYLISDQSWMRTVVRFLELKGYVFTLDIEHEAIAVKIKNCWCNK